MKNQDTVAYMVLAQAFCYPSAGQIDDLKAGLERIPAGVTRTSLERFVEKISRLSIGDWEELHTRTLDLNPPAAPYVGFQTWGESYQRGVFLSKLNREMLEIGVDMEGELPDHLIPVLRYLGMVKKPLPDLIEILVPAVQRMQVVLRKADGDNPYGDLLDGILDLCKERNKEAA